MKSEAEGSGAELMGKAPDAVKARGGNLTSIDLE